MFASNALAFWYGSILIEHKEYNAIFNRDYESGDIFIILFSILIGSFSIGNLSPCLKSFSQGKVAGYKIFQILDSKPLVLENLDTGIKLKEIIGNF